MAISPESVKVLIIDDSSFARRTLSEELKKLGFRLMIEAGNAQEAVELLRKHQVGLIFCDHLMPGLTGTSFLHKLRRQERHRNVPFLLITGHSDLKVVAEVVDYDGDGMVVKPFSSGVLEKKIQDAFTKRGLSLAPMSRPIEGTAFPVKSGGPAAKTERVPPAQRLFLEGQDQEQGGDPEAAMRSYGEAVAIEPSFLKAHEAMARLAQQNGDTASAIEHLSACVKLSPMNLQRRATLADLLAKAGRREECLASLHTLLEEGGGYPGLLRRMADTYAALGESESALNLLRRALAADPGPIETHLRLSGLLLELGQAEPAVDAALAGLAHHPGRVELRLALARSLLAAGREQEALTELNRVKATQPDRPELIELIGRAARPALTRQATNPPAPRSKPEDN